MTSILIIEDNEDLAFGLRKTLEFEGYEVRVAGDGPAGLEAARSRRPDLIVLDVMLPEMDGFEVLESVRSDGGQMPVLMLTARDEEADVVMGFHSGADDYVTKPFSTLELVARVRALLRRAGSDASADGRSPVRSFGDIEVDEGSRTVTKGGKQVALTPKEFDLLVALLRRGGNVASRPELLDEVWQYANSDVMTRTVDIHIAELRRKLEDDPSDPAHILTVRKAGYRLET